MLIGKRNIFVKELFYYVINGLIIQEIEYTISYMYAIINIKC